MANPIIKKIRNTKPKVVAILETSEQLRDDDEKLVARFWSNELQAMKKHPTHITGLQFLLMYSEGKLTPADIITRARRKIQEDNPALRGIAWNERQGKEKDVRQEIMKKDV